MTALSDAAAAGFAWAMVEMCHRTPAGRVSVHGDATLLVTRANTASLNYVMVTAPAPDPADVAAAAQEASGLDVPWSMEFRSAPSAEITDVADSFGLTRVSRPLFMTAAAKDLTLRGTPKVRVDLVAPDLWEPYTDVLTHAFEAAEGLFGTLMAGTVLERPGFRGYLAYRDGVAVGTALGTITDGALTVFNIGVRPEHRGQGIGRALTERVLTDGLADGARTACLQSSDLGRPLYESLGFRAAERWYTFEKP